MQGGLSELDLQIPRFTHMPSYPDDFGFLFAIHMLTWENENEAKRNVL